MKITQLEAYAVSCPVPPAAQVSLGIGRTLKRDAVLLKVITESGLIGWGEAHAGRAPSVIAELINATLAPLVVGESASDIQGLWTRIYRLQLASHGTGAAAAMALSGLDMALWDLRGKAAGKPLYEVLGGTRQALRAYAGGISFGYGPTEQLVDEALGAQSAGYRALKLRLGMDRLTDVARLQAVRAALGPTVELLTDANCAYSLEDARYVRAALDELGAGWLEEPFSAHDFLAYRALAPHGRTPLAAGENHFLVEAFERLADDGVVRVWQPDLSKCGGISEALRIAAVAQVHGIQLHLHTSVTGLNVAASLHFLSALSNPGYFEADYSTGNRLRTHLCAPLSEVSEAGNFLPPTGPGLGVSIDEAQLSDYPVLRGVGYR
jgi:L-alanine-DL-glutamate epimerase-like enolase superfamily enzyme